MLSGLHPTTTDTDMTLDYCTAQGSRVVSPVLQKFMALLHASHGLYAVSCMYWMLYIHFLHVAQVPSPFTWIMVPISDNPRVTLTGSPQVPKRTMPRNNSKQPTVSGGANILLVFIFSRTLVYMLFGNCNLGTSSTCEFEGLSRDEREGVCVCVCVCVNARAR